jgi:hypothetical protein
MEMNKMEEKRIMIFRNSRKRGTACDNRFSMAFRHSGDIKFLSLKNFTK